MCAFLNLSSDKVKNMHMAPPNFEITVACDLNFHWYLRTLGLKFQKARTKIELFLSLSCWLCQFYLDSPKKRTNVFVLFAFLLFSANKKNSFVRFLGELRRTQTAFGFI